MKCLKCKTETSNPKFCSRSCAMSINNLGVRRHGSAPKNHKCAACPKWTTNPKYCGRACAEKGRASIQQKLFRAGLIQGAHNIRTHMLARHGNRCMNPKCTWDFGKLSVVCQVDHRDGNATNNKPRNLRLLCPNCHSRTKTYGMKNFGNGRPWRRKAVMGRCV